MMLERNVFKALLDNIDDDKIPGLFQEMHFRSIKLDITTAYNTYLIRSRIFKEKQMLQESAQFDMLLNNLKNEEQQRDVRISSIRFLGRLYMIFSHVDCDKLYGYLEFEENEKTEYL